MIFLCGQSMSSRLYSRLLAETVIDPQTVEVHTSKPYATLVVDMVYPIATDYYMVGILDRPQNQNYPARAGGASRSRSSAPSSPPPWAAMWGTAYLAPRNTERTFTAMPRKKFTRDRRRPGNHID